MLKSVVILNFNSVLTIREMIESVRRVSTDVHVVGSFGTDGTRDIARDLDARVVQRPFEDYASQQNGAIKKLPLERDLFERRRKRT